MPLHLKPIAFEARHFDEGQSFEARDEWRVFGVVTITHEGTRADISLAASLDDDVHALNEFYRELDAELLARGVEIAAWRHHGKSIVRNLVTRKTHCEPADGSTCKRTCDFCRRH